MATPFRPHRVASPSPHPVHFAHLHRFYRPSAHHCISNKPSPAQPSHLHTHTHIPRKCVAKSQTAVSPVAAATTFKRRSWQLQTARAANAASLHRMHHHAARLIAAAIRHTALISNARRARSLVSAINASTRACSTVSRLSRRIVCSPAAVFESFLLTPTAPILAASLFTLSARHCLVICGRCREPRLVLYPAPLAPSAREEGKEAALSHHCHRHREPIARAIDTSHVGTPRRLHRPSHRFALVHVTCTLSRSSYRNHIPTKTRVTYPPSTYTPPLPPIHSSHTHTIYRHDHRITDERRHTPPLIHFHDHPTLTYAQHVLPATPVKQGNHRNEEERGGTRERGFLHLEDEKKTKTTKENLLLLSFHTHN